MSQDTGAVNRKTLFLILVLSAAPFVLATVLYLVWKPAAKTDGVFLNPQAPLQPAPLLDAGGKAAALEKLRGKWLLLMASTAPCDALCTSTVYRMRQVRMAQGVYMNRVERIWLAQDVAAVNAGLPEAEGVHIRLDPQAALLRQLPVAAGGPAGSIWLIDPHGNLVMRYDASLDPVKMIREMSRIIKINNGLG